MASGRPAVLRRLPRMRWRHDEVLLPVPLEEQGKYPSLSDDFAFLEEELVPVFVDLDRRAQREQNRFRRQQLLIFVGGFVTAVFGAIQAALAEATWPGLVVALTGAAVGSLTFVARQRGSHRAYLHARLAAEQLRSLYFRFLGRVGPFAQPGERRRALIGAVEAINHQAKAT